MTQKTWSTVEVSAYLDGELEPERQTAFETDLAQSPALRQRVEEMKQVISLVAATPLREPPRNYILTPSMVEKPQPEPKRQRAWKPFLFMRLATSLVALAFVVTFGLTLSQQGLLPGTATHSRELPQAARQVGSDAASEAAPPAPAEGPIAAMKASATEEAPSAPEGTLSPQEAAALAPMPEAAATDGEAGETIRGMGGGGDTAPTIEAPVGVAEAAPVEATPGAPNSESEASGHIESFQAEATDAARPVEGLAADQAPAAEPLSAPQESTAAQPALPIGVSVGLGVATLAMAGVTFWLSRRRL